MKSIIKVFAILALITVPGFAAAGELSVPSVIGFYSAISDEGGNPISDGEKNISFRIKDAQGEMTYEETQRVSVIDGRISALIGNGLDVSGAPTGGVPAEAIDPTDAKYLEVEVEGYSPISGMELATVPYCSYAQKAFSVTDAAADEVAKVITGGVGKEAIVLRDELDTVYNDPASASYIGVAASELVNSQSGDLQHVLNDLDDAIAANAQGLANETSARANADNQRVSRSGDSINGTLTMNGNIIMGAGNTVDGYDVGTQFNALGARVSNFSKVIWGTVNGGSTPSFNGPGIDVTSLGSGKYRVDFGSPMSSANYAVVVTSRANSSETPGVPRIYDKDTEGFVAEFVGGVSNNFDFIAIGL